MRSKVCLGISARGEQVALIADSGERTGGGEHRRRPPTRVGAAPYHGVLIEDLVTRAG